jgi:hypothetical protein
MGSQQVRAPCSLGRGVNHGPVPAAFRLCGQKLSRHLGEASNSLGKDCPSWRARRMDADAGMEEIRVVEACRRDADHVWHLAWGSGIRLSEPLGYEVSLSNARPLVLMCPGIVGSVSPRRAHSRQRPGGGLDVREYARAPRKPTPEVPRRAVPDQKARRAAQSPARVLDAFWPALRVLIVVELQGANTDACRGLERFRPSDYLSLTRTAGGGLRACVHSPRSTFHSGIISARFNSLLALVSVVS